MIVYADTSALIKLYVREAHSDAVRAVVTAAEAVATSVAAYPEARAALVRAADDGRLGANAYTSRVELLDSDWQRYFVVALTGEVAMLAGALAEKHRLRGFDAVHLASAMSTVAPEDEPITFLAFDERLTAAAKAEGLAIPSL